MKMAFQIAGVLFAATPALADEAAQQSQTQQEDTSSIILAEKPAPTPPAAPNLSAGRPVSPAIAAEISLVMPAYAPGSSSASSGSPTADLRNVDKPKNQIPRLPAEMMQKYVVRESRVPVFRTRDLYTKAGLIDLSLKEHPGLHFGNFFNLNAKAAYETEVEEQLRAEKLELDDLSRAMAIGSDHEEEALMEKARIDAAFNSQDQEGPAGVK